MKKILLVFGTRPEAIKMMPIIKELELSTFFKTSICVTSQHDEMLKEVLDVFNIKPDYDLKIMKPNQTLFYITNTILIEIEKVYDIVNPDIVLVHGDTTTAFVSTLAAFYKRIDVGHVEAGLRTNDIYSPYPEEFNRQAISLIAKYHFAPTELNKKNLIARGVNSKRVYVTGNTALDVMKYTLVENYKHELIEWLNGDSLILLTAHRRETSEDDLKEIFFILNEFIKNNSFLKMIYPLHPNSKFSKLANMIFQDNSKIAIIRPLNVVDFHNLMNIANLVITDSGGIQEEITYMNKPLIILREKTEREEILKTKNIELTGFSTELFKISLNKMLNLNYKKPLFSKTISPFGDGYAATKIIEILKENYFLNCDNHV